MRGKSILVLPVGFKFFQPSFDSNDDENINLKNYQTDDDLIKPSSGSLSTIEEDCSNLEAVNEDEED